MTFQSLSALTLGPGAASVAKSQESGGARPERTGPAGRDFSTFLSQAMLSKDWTGAKGLPRQGLADPGTQALDPGLKDTSSPDTASAALAAPRNPRDVSSTGTSRDSSRTPSTTTATNQELTQRALRTASLRTAQSRAEGASHGRPALSDTRGRKAISRRDDEPHGNASAGNPMAVPPSVPHRPLESAQDVSGTDTSVGADKADTHTSNAADAAPVPQAQPALLATTPWGIPSGATPAPGADGLTTLQLSPQMQIITSGQGVVNEQSLQAFAQSMGIDANQFKQLVTAAPTGSMDMSGLRAGVTATDALTGTPILPAAPTDVTTIDLSQVLPAGMPLEDLHIELMGNRRGPSVDAGSLSTLEVLGMREGAIGAEGITSAQASADTGASGQQPDTSSMGQSSLGASARASANTAAAPAAQNMAEHFEKLSAKLATEMAGRIHEQFSQGEWKMKFALKPASLGQVDVQLEMRDGKLAAVLQADNPMTQDLLQNGSQRLRDALSQMGLSQSSVLVGDGRSQSFQGDRHPGAQGMASAPAHHQDSPDESVQSVASAPRRDSLSQLDFYA